MSSLEDLLLSYSRGQCSWIIKLYAGSLGCNFEVIDLFCYNVGQFISLSYFVGM